MRLRPLTEAECYARCYGGRRGEAANFVRVLAPGEEWVGPGRTRPAELSDSAVLGLEAGRGSEAA